MSDTVKEAERTLIEDCMELLYQMEHSEGRLTRTCERCLTRVLTSTKKLNEQNKGKGKS